MVDIAHPPGLAGVDRAEFRGSFVESGLLARWGELDRVR
jgi:hypothetical protein